MSHTMGVAQVHETGGVQKETLKKGVVHVRPGEGTRSLRVFDELLTYKVPSDQTGGAYSLFEATTQPGAGPPPHVHHREDESFYVLEGEYEFLVDGHTLKAEAGSLIYVPKGTLHAHKGVGEGVGRMLMSQTPGGLYELFFEKAGRPADGDDAGPPVFEEWPDLARIMEVAAEHGIEIPTPVAQHIQPTNTTEGGQR